MKLGVDQELFWAGHRVGPARVPSPALCELPGPCWNYRLTVTEPAARLRVALGAILPEPGDVRAWPDFPASDTQTVFRVQVLDSMSEKRNVH